jgi:hypothetical protein
MSSRVDPEWVQVQHRSFMAWVNNQLKKNESEPLDDLPSGFATGENLVKLLEILSGKKAKHAVKRDPTMRIQKIQNAKIALDIVDSEKIKLINISAEDMIDGKLKAILGLMWSLILRYQINKNNATEKRKIKKVKTVEVPVDKKDDKKVTTVEVVEEVEEELPVQKSDSSAKRDLLQWVQNQVKDYDVPCKDFTKSWQDGKLLTALIHSLQPNAISYPPAVNDPLVANTEAINAADLQLDIPQIIGPDDITHNPEELSMMTYISYFRDYQIENAKKAAIVKEIPKVDPEQSELKGPSTAECGDIATFTITAIDKDGNIKVKLDDDEVFVLSISSPKLTEPIEPIINSTGDGNYVAEFSPPLPGVYKAYAAINGIPIKNSPHTITAPQRTDPIKCLLYGPGLKQDGSVKAQRETNFTIQSRDRAGDALKIGGDRFQVSIEAENKNVPNKLTDHKNGTYTVDYTPQIAADHIVTVTLDGRVVGPQGPIIVPVTMNPKISALNSHAYGPGIEPWGLMTSEPTQFTIVGVDQDGKTMKNGDLTADFDIKFTDTRTGSPVDIKTEVVDNDDGTYTVSYETPAISGPYACAVSINNQDLADSPFDVFMRGKISYPDSIITGLSAILRSDVPVEFTIRAKDKNGQDIRNGGDEFEVVCTYNPDDDDTDIPVLIEDNQDGTHTVRFTPKRAGIYKVSASSKDGVEPLKNSPVILNMEPTPYAPYSALKPKGITKSHKGMVTADFDLSMHDKFNKKFNNIKARVTAKVTDEDGNEIEAQVVENVDGKLSIKFEPKNSQKKFTCSVRLDGKEVGSGPVEVNLGDRFLNKKAQLKRKASPYYCEAYGPGLEGAKQDTMAMFTVEARDEKGELLQPEGVHPDVFKKNSDLVKRLLAYQPKAFDSDTNPLAPYLDLRELRKNHNNQKASTRHHDNYNNPNYTDYDDDYGPHEGYPTTPLEPSYNQKRPNHTRSSFYDPNGPHGNVENANMSNNDPNRSTANTPTKLPRESSLIGKDYNTVPRGSVENANYGPNNPRNTNVKDPSKLPRDNSYTGNDPNVLPRGGVEKMNSPYNDPKGTSTRGLPVRNPRSNEPTNDYIQTNEPSARIPRYNEPIDDSNGQVRGGVKNVNVRNSPRGIDANNKEPLFDDDMDEIANNPYYQHVNPDYFKDQKKNCPCKITIKSPSDQDEETDDEFTSGGIEPIILNTGPGIFTVLYCPTDMGDHEISITADDKHIPKSPWTAIVAGDIDPLNVYLEGPGLKKCYVGKPTFFNIIARDSDNRDIRVGGDDFEVFLKDPTDQQTTNPIIIDDEGTGTYKVTYTPAVPGVHTVSVKYRGENVRDSPFKVTAKDASAAPDNMKSNLIGKIENIPAKKPYKFNVKLVNPKGEDILSGGDIVKALIKPKKGAKTLAKNIPEFEAYVVDHGTGRYTVEFTPDFAGDYEMYVNVGSDELPINNKPFEFTVLPTVSPLYTKLSNWKFDIESEKALDTKDFYVNFTSPQNVTIVPYVERKHAKLFTVHYEPPEIESGFYEMNISLTNKNKVRGSPFQQTFAYLEHFDEEPQQSDIFQFEAN